VACSDLASGSILEGRTGELRGLSVVVLTTDQLSTALTLLELDGVARRLVIFPNESSLEHLPSVLEASHADAVLSDRNDLPSLPPHTRLVRPQPHSIPPQTSDRPAPLPTEWITLTSGTMGAPKLVVHTLASLTGALLASQVPAQPVVWGTLYDIRRFGGLQVFFRAALSGSSLALSSPGESIASYLARVGSLGVTHISGTPSQWRRALMSGSAHLIDPAYVRLSGEIADQAILNNLHATYPKARISHAFGSSEAGTVFEVKDGIAGFPADLSVHGPSVEMKVENGTLRVRSPWTATRYQGKDAPVLKDADGFVDTGDVVDLRDRRYSFIGRRDGRINVGGLKVHPEEVEAVLNLHSDVQMSRVLAKKSPVTGSVVVADIVLAARAPAESCDQQALQADILQFCHKVLASHKVPAILRFVSSLGLADSGKMIRRNDG
jgi:acyl-coenzyme A synthetase/AMP-(fatty) acid ligase